MNKNQLYFCIKSVVSLLIAGLVLMALNYLLAVYFSPVWAVIYIIVVPPALTIFTILFSAYILLKGKFFSQRPSLISALLFLILVFLLTYPIFNISLFRRAINFMQGTCKSVGYNIASSVLDALPCLLQTLSYWILLSAVLCGLPILIVNILTKRS